MKALLYDHFGSPDFLEIREVAKPVPKKNEVLVKVHAVSVNDWDWLQLNGKDFGNRLLAGLSKPKRILGSDIAGHVESIGSEVRRFKVGDAVLGDLTREAFNGFGGFAQFVRAREDELMLKPDRMTFEQAAALPGTGGIAFQGLFTKGPLEAGKKVLINGAGGGVGTFAIQLAKLYDVELTGIDSEAKLDTLRTLGCDHVMDYRKEDFTTSGKRYDFILDIKTRRSPFDYAKVLNPGGTYASTGGTSHLPYVGFIGPWIGRFTNKTMFVLIAKPNISLPRLLELCDAGRIKPIIDRIYKFSEAREAFRRYGAADHIGKIVVAIDH